MSLFLILNSFNLEMGSACEPFKTTDLLDAVPAGSNLDVSCRRRMQLMSEEAR